MNNYIVTLESEYLQAKELYQRLFSVYGPYRMAHKYTNAKVRMQELYSELTLLKLAMESYE